MHFHLLAVGTRMPAWVTSGYEEYAKRIRGDYRLQLTEIAMAKRGKNANAERLCEEEGQRLIAALPSRAHCVALDVTGRSWSTETLAKQIEDWSLDGRAVAFMVGGPDGLSRECLHVAEQRLSLSAMTLPHPLVRIVLAEQIYRALSIIKGHPYHRA